MIGIDYSSLDINNKDKYKLSSIFSEDNLLFTLTRISDSKIVQIKEIIRLKENYFLDYNLLLDIFKQNKLLDKNIVTANAAFFSTEFSLVPESLLHSEINDYKHLLSSVKQYFNDYKIQKSYIRSINAYNFFPFPLTIEKFLKDNFDSFMIFHANDSLIDYSRKLIDNKDFLLVNFHEHVLQILVFRDIRFIQTNVYEIKTKDDILYYILLNIKNNGIPLNTANVYLTGRVSEDSSIHNLLYEHIKNISFVDNIPRNEFSNVFLGKPKHLFFDIYSLSKCE